MPILALITAVVESSCIGCWMASNIFCASILTSGVPCLTFSNDRKFVTA